MINPREFGEKMARCWKGYEPVPGKTPYSEDSCRPVGSGAKKSKKKDAPKGEKKAAEPFRNKFLDAQVPGYKARVAGATPAMDKLMGKKPAQVIGTAEKSPASKLPQKIKKAAETEPEQKMAGSPAWQKSDGKNPEGGLNEKGRKSYERETGGNLKAPVTESNPKGDRAKRQNSFCSRMCGMKRVNTGSEAKKDPDSRINKSLRKWNCKCSSAMEFGEKLAAQNDMFSSRSFDPVHAQKIVREHMAANPNFKLDYNLDEATPRQLYDTSITLGKFGPGQTPNTTQRQFGMRYGWKEPRPPRPGATMPKSKVTPSAGGSGAGMSAPSARPAGTGNTGPAVPPSPTVRIPVPPGAQPPSPQPSGVTQPVPPQPPRI